MNYLCLYEKFKFFFFIKKKVQMKNFQKVKKKNFLLSVFIDKLKKKILEKVILNLNTVNTQKNHIFKKSFLKKNKEKIIFTRYSQLKFNYRYSFFILKISENILFLLSSDFIGQCKSIKIENIMNFTNFLQNFKEILKKISKKWKKTLVSFPFFFYSLNLKQEIKKFLKFENMYFVFLLYQNFLNKKLKIKKFFFVFCVKDFTKKLNIFTSILNEMKNKIYFKESFSFLQNQFLKKKWKFALFFVQIFLKTSKKFLKESKTKFFLDFTILKKKFFFLFFQIFIELQFSFFLFFKNFESVHKKKVENAFLPKQYIKKNKKFTFFPFPFEKIFISSLNNLKIKIINFLLVFCKKNKKTKFDFFENLLKQKNFKMFINKMFFKIKKDTFKKKIKKVFQFKNWLFFLKNLNKFIYNNSKLFFQFNKTIKEETKFCIVFSQNIFCKIEKIFYLFFIFQKIISREIFKKTKTYSRQKILDSTKFKKNLNFIYNNELYEYNLTVKDHYKHFIYSNFIFFLNSMNILKETQKNLFFVFFEFRKKNAQIFFEYFCLLNFFKTHIDFRPLSSQNSNDFQTLLHLYLKFPFIDFLLETEKNIYLQNLIYYDYSTFLSFLKIFLQKNIQKNKNFFFKPIFYKFFSFFSKKNISNLYKFDQIFLLNDLKKNFTETKIENFSRFNKKNFIFDENAFVLPKQKNILLKNQTFNFDISFLLVNLFSCSFEKSFFHLSKTFKLKKIKKYFLKKYNFLVFFNVSFFENFFSIQKKFFLNSSLEKPIDFLFKNYYENFVIYNFFICFNLNSKKIINLMKTHFSNFKKLNIWFSHILANVQMNNPNRKLKTFPLINLFKTFYVTMSKKWKGILQILRFQNMFWLISNTILFQSTKFYKHSFFSCTAFFSSFFIQKFQKIIFYNQNKFRKNVLFSQNSFYFHLDEFCVYFHSLWKKKNKVFFYFQKIKTPLDIQIHLKQCQLILKNSIGQKQLFFMKKLQKKIKSWCQKYKERLENGYLNYKHHKQQNSIFVKASTKEIFYYCDLMLLKFLWNWSLRTHPTKSKYWIKKKYFHYIHSKKWFFGKKIGQFFVCLPLHSQTQI